MLSVSDLHAYYGKSHVLHGVNLFVGRGEIVSLLGRNGVGRSTTIKAPPEKIFAVLNDFHRWTEWSPREKLDPQMKRTLGGAASGRGAT